MTFARLKVPLDTPPMEARSNDELPLGEGWQFEPKWDGFRCLAFRDGGEVDLRSKSGKPLGRYFPEIVEALLTLDADLFVLDGELVLPVDEVLSFGALQLRLHPATSRIEKLSRETPAQMMVFDEPLAQRRKALEAFMKTTRSKSLLLSPATTGRRMAERWFAQTGGALDGIVAKPLEALYQPGERAMTKVKQQRTADCVVGGYRYASKGGGIGSLLLGLYDEEGRLNHVGFCSSLSAAERRGLKEKLEQLRKAPGFTGRAPGGPSRWSTERSAEWEPLAPKLVVEVEYDHVSNERFRHGTRFVRWRPDKAPRQCTMEQLA
jgi:ATP-dependent DNA ligase